MIIASGLSLNGGQPCLNVLVFLTVVTVLQPMSLVCLGKQINSKKAENRNDKLWQKQLPQKLALKIHCGGL